MQPLSDQELIEKALAGDARAFRPLVERHQGFVYRLAYRFVGTVGESEDIMQEAFIRLWKNLNRYRPEIKVTTWLYKIVTNLSLDHLKSRHNRTRRGMEDINDQNSIAGTLAADQSLLDEELLAAIRTVTSELSPKQKAVFILRDLEEVEMQEISEILSMDSGQVRSNLYYARKKVSEMVAAYYEIKQSKT